jgi:hypothetical protein
VPEAAFAKVAAGDATIPQKTLNRTARLMTWALVVLLVWLPLQTPVAIAVFQYGHSVNLARVTLGLKDVAVALLVLYALAMTWRSLNLRWFDKAAIGYLFLIGIYSVVPWLLGSHISSSSVVTSAREFSMPVELYALGRLACLNGADLKFIFKVFVAVSAVIAAIAVLEYSVVPITFWSSTLDLVSFERVVQGMSWVHSLARASLLGDYGTGHRIYARAIGTFPHPVGAAEYFILPLGLTVAAWFSGEGRGKRLVSAGLVALTLLFGLAIVVTISRGHWIAAAIVIALCGLLFQRLRMAFLLLTIAGIFVVGVPPFSYSISSALNRTDSSALGHIRIIGADAQTAIENILGLGLGGADQVILKTPNSTTSAPPATSSNNETSGLGENLYLSTLLNTGPLGAAAFIAWCLGILVALLRAARRAANKWLVGGSAAALGGSMAAAMSSAALVRFTTAASTWLLLGLATGLVVALYPDALRLSRPKPGVPGWISRRLRREPQA